MHEHGLADDVFAALMKQAATNGRRIGAVTIAVGELAGIDPETLRHGLCHCWEHEQMKPFEVTVIVRDAALQCAACGREAPIEDAMRCPECGSEDVTVKPNTGVSITGIEYV